jgi:aryl-alcohol dehydrogenase-like predicted oxidoreductase
MRYVDAEGLSCSVIGLGTWQFGSREWGYGVRYATVTAVEILHRAIELGVNFIDTAEMYGFGASERIIGDALEGKVDGVVLATKFFPLIPLPAFLVDHAYRSARRLKVDVIDLYQIHFPNPAVPIREQVKGLKVLLDRGVVRHVGVSNFSLAQWREAEDVLERPIVSNQVHLSLLSMRPLEELVPWAQAQGRMVIAYSPLEQGVLTGKFSPDNRPGGFRRVANRNFSRGMLERVRPLLGLMSELAKAKNASPSEVALAWIIAHPQVIAIPGASSLAQLEHNVSAADLELSRDEIDALTDVARRVKTR